LLTLEALVKDAFVLARSHVGPWPEMQRAPEYRFISKPNTITSPTPSPA
jgi:hypothetical protein